MENEKKELWLLYWMIFVSVLLPATGLWLQLAVFICDGSIYGSKAVRPFKFSYSLRFAIIEEFKMSHSHHGLVHSDLIPVLFSSRTCAWWSYNRLILVSHLYVRILYPSHSHNHHIHTFHKRNIPVAMSVPVPVSTKDHLRNPESLSSIAVKTSDLPFLL